MNAPYTEEPPRAEIEATRGPLVLEFGDNFCGICRAAQPEITRALATRPDVRHLKIADGRGRPLGRAFGVKLWPTLVFLQDGREIDRLVRPVDHHPIAKALRALPAS
ncbi:thioredoxin family protein [Pseudorhodoferax sp.]|uniref:thioredoxin family protein n=1 Tax=Pseudorhodoferax sp. TaxID=1993553 RepID=UPI0039E53044